ncbi:MAG: GNAT family N-acetyltransferase [Ekhidna sp.]|nr:GNAT family N-acetyltransferase [Ekhidna sp.]
MNEWYVPLRGELVTLQPLTKIHIQSMRLLTRGSDVWKWYTEDLTDPDRLEKWMTSRLESSSNGEMMSYAVILNSTNAVIGSTSYGHISWTEKTLEVGWTWLSQSHIGTGINKHVKFLMLNHAFEVMGVERLELRTDEENVRSRRAMEKIGAKFDGTLRNHRYTQGNKRRNTVIYSIIRPEWSYVRDEIFKEF